MPRWLPGALTLCTLAAGVALMPSVAAACPVCFSGNEANREAYYLTFLLMTLLPVSSVLGLLWWLRRRLREQAAQAS